MKAPPDHQVWLAKADYAPDDLGLLAPQEAALLRQYGHWLTALTKGQIEPVTVEQVHFLQVHRGDSQPVTPMEQAWSHYQRIRRGVERGEKRVKDPGPPAPPTAVCHNCHANLAGKLDRSNVCPKCRWLVCHRCRSCGCYYPAR